MSFIVSPACFCLNVGFQRNTYLSSFCAADERRPMMGSVESGWGEDRGGLCAKVAAARRPDCKSAKVQNCTASSTPLHCSCFIIVLLKLHCICFIYVLMCIDHCSTHISKKHCKSRKMNLCSSFKIWSWSWSYFWRPHLGTESKNQNGNLRWHFPLGVPPPPPP